MTRLSIPTRRRPTTPGEMLIEEFLAPLGVTQTAFAERIGVTYPRLNEIVNGKRGVTPDTALRFSRALGTSPDFWLNLQQVLDLYDALHSSKAAEIRRIKPLAAISKNEIAAAQLKPRARRRMIA
jgi:addiction module HigA family antidote